MVDAISDKPVGTSVLTTQALLQQQRDLMIDDGKMPVFCFGRPPAFKGKRKMTLELRQGIESGVSGDFFVPFDADEKNEKGRLVRRFCLLVGLDCAV